MNSSREFLRIFLTMLDFCAETIGKVTPVIDDVYGLMIAAADVVIYL